MVLRINLTYNEKEIFLDQKCISSEYENFSFPNWKNEVGKINNTSNSRITEEVKTNNIANGITKKGVSTLHTNEEVLLKIRSKSFFNSIRINKNWMYQRKLK